MRKLSLLILGIVVVAFVSCKGSATSKIDKEKLEQATERDKKMAEPPTIEFDKTEYDFGTVVEGEKVKGAFKLTNTGTSKLIIFSAKGSCGCTVPEWPKKPILPNETAEVKFTFNSSGRSGGQSKTITLKTNTKKGNERLRIKGIVTKKNKK
ncbi:MAG: DUF1573 domain-containing protein [Flavobacteriaceae bacterium]|nr:DUF1573 domain-containing protein [Flavobacteriaceae bacterium]